MDFDEWWELNGDYIHDYYMPRLGIRHTIAWAWQDGYNQAYDEVEANRGRAAPINWHSRSPNKEE